MAVVLVAAADRLVPPLRPCRVGVDMGEVGTGAGLFVTAVAVGVTAGGWLAVAADGRLMLVT